tara:strand:+ start:1475 stop:1966 length:492 start_codon:yes stop_codon:yes gene_type:complete
MLSAQADPTNNARAIASLVPTAKNAKVEKKEKVTVHTARLHTVAPLFYREAGRIKLFKVINVQHVEYHDRAPKGPSPGDEIHYHVEGPMPQEVRQKFVYRDTLTRKSVTTAYRNKKNETWIGPGLLPQLDLYASFIREAALRSLAPDPPKPEKKKSTHRPNDI